MSIDWDVQRLYIARSHIHGIRSEWYTAIFNVHFLPTHRYPIGAPTPDIGEIGSLVRMKGDKITKVIRRVVLASAKK